jgi:hypothetical protein
VRKKRKYPLKAWGDRAWRRKLSKTLTVSRVDENIPTDEQTRRRKPWYVALTRASTVVSPKVAGLPAGNGVLLSENEVLALVAYLLEPQTVVWSENPSPTESGKYQVFLFMQPGMVAISGDGRIWNGEAPWTPSYFEGQEPIDKSVRVSPKVHTLPWRLELGKRRERHRSKAASRGREDDVRVAAVRQTDIDFDQQATRKPSRRSARFAP